MSAARIAVVRRRTVILAALGLLAALGVGSYLMRDDPATQINIYNPAGFKAVETVDGSCWTGSLAARAGAFRCAAGNAIYDPCFVTNGAVACPQGDPADNQGVLINLTEPLPEPPEAWENPPDPANPMPWDMTLANGGRCGTLTGTRPPENPMGCLLPDPPDTSVYCSFPLPLAADPAVFASVCGVWEGGIMEIVEEKVYLVEEMWL